MAWPKDIWFRAYLKGNLLMPQTYAAGALFLVRAVLEHNELADLRAVDDLSASQLALMRRVMHAAHGVRRIPAGDSAFLERAQDRGQYDLSRTILIEDEKLHYIWNRFRERAVWLGEALTESPRGILVANQLVEAFHTKDCRELLRRFRNEYDRRRDGSDSAALLLRKTILLYVDSQVRPPNEGRLLQEHFET